MTVREQGSSNKLFYYTRTGPFSTFNMRKEIVLKQPVQVETWTLCVEEVLKVFPEFAVRPVIKDNRVFYEENHAAAPVYRRARTRAFGTEDTNGYLFYHLADQRRILISFFHGLCDAVGMELFLDCVLYLYGKKSGFLQAEDTIPEIYARRLEADCPVSLAQLSDEELDPYGFLARTSDPSPNRTPAEGEAFFIPRQEDLVHSAKVHVYSVHLETGEILALSKKMGVSLTALLIPLFGQAIARSCRAQEETVRIMLPVNLRPIYGVQTMVNFSDGISFSLDGAMRRESIAVQAGQCLKQLKARASRECFDPVLSDNVKTVQAFERGDTLAEQVEPEPLVSPERGKHPPFTCVLTYPRGMREFSFLSEISYCCAASTSLTAVVYAWQKHMTVRCIQKSDSDAIVKALAICLEEAGIGARICDEGCMSGDVLLMSRIAKR